jgi:hypothetical protein
MLEGFWTSEELPDGTEPVTVIRVDGLELLTVAVVEIGSAEPNVCPIISVSLVERN